MIIILCLSYDVNQDQELNDNFIALLSNPKPINFDWPNSSTKTDLCLPSPLASVKFKSNISIFFCGFSSGISEVKIGVSSFSGIKEDVSSVGWLLSKGGVA